MSTHCTDNTCASPKKNVLSAFFSVPSAKAVVATTSLALVSALAALNFTPALSIAIKGAKATGPCGTFDEVMARPKNRDVASVMQGLDTAREIYTFASATKQKMCAGTVDPGTVAQYNPVSQRTLVKSLDQIGQGAGAREGAVTTGHEMYHAWQAKNARTSAEKMSRLYDLHSNMLTSLYMEAAAYAYEARLNHEYMDKNPERRKDIEFHFEEELLQVFDARFKEVAHLGTEQRRNLAAQAVFEYFLTSENMASLYRGAYLEAYTKNTEWYKNPHRLFGFQRAELEDIKSMTRLPNGFDLYRFDRLAAPEEISGNNFLPIPQKKENVKPARLSKRDL